LANSNEANALLAVNTARKVAASGKQRLRGKWRGMSRNVACFAGLGWGVAVLAGPGQSLRVTDCPKSVELLTLVVC
jgi:hypothetical protein